MSKFLYFVFILVVSFNTNARDLCDKFDTTIGFFNGVWNKPKDAEFSKEILERRIKESDIDIDYTKTKYLTFYNDSDGWILDLLEVYEQRLNELGKSLKDDNGNIRYEYFDDFVNSSGAWTRTFSANSIEGILVSKAVHDITVRYLNNQVNKLSKNKNYLEHQGYINDLTKESLEANKLMFIAHSQGNLFVNEAYKYIKTKKGYDNKEAVKVVHIAPASTELKGDYVLVDMDIVINLFLKVFPGKSFNPNEDIYRQLPKVIIGALLTLDPILEPYKLLGIYLLGSTNYSQAIKEIVNLAIDPMGHGLVTTYLNPNFRVLNSVLTKIDNAFKFLESPDIKEEEKAKKGFFTAMVTWEVDGDIDLRVIEPDKLVTDAWRKQGNSGELDIDNRVSFGPEHYYASCDSEKLQTGVYTLSIINYRGFPECRPDDKNCKLPPPFRKVNLYVESNDNGELLSQSIILGNNNKLNRGFNMMDLSISKDILTNKYSIEIIKDKPRVITDWIIVNKPPQSLLSFSRVSYILDNENSDKS